MLSARSAEVEEACRMLFVVCCLNNWLLDYCQGEKKKHENKNASESVSKKKKMTQARVQTEPIE